MTKVDILYLTWNRREFTEASLSALMLNTDWELVNSICFSDDGSTDGTLEMVQVLNYGMRRFALDMVLPLASWVLKTRTGSPVAVMNNYLDLQETENWEPAPIFVKLDNDVVVPRGWLEESIDVMEYFPEIDLLGIEPGCGIRPQATAAMPNTGEPRSVCTCDFIGGIGLMRRSAFDGKPRPPAAGRFGFGHWQEAHPEVKKAWLAPGLPLFLLNRLPMEPWASLSKRYIAEGWQRPWPDPYTENDRHMWEWWKP